MWFDEVATELTVFVREAFGHYVEFFPLLSSFGVDRLRDFYHAGVDVYWLKRLLEGWGHDPVPSHLMLKVVIVPRDQEFQGSYHGSISQLEGCK